MRPVVRSLKRDIRRMVTVPAAWIVIVGLLFVPALYAWFNIVGFWDPYSNTGKIRVAVANEDQGAINSAGISSQQSRQRKKLNAGNPMPLSSFLPISPRVSQALLTAPIPSPMSSTTSMRRTMLLPRKSQEQEHLL